MLSESPSHEATKDHEQSQEEMESNESPLLSDEDSVEDEHPEHVDVDLSKLTELWCPICLGIIRNTRAVMECMHRFCKDCIEKSMRLNKHECPVCRVHVASRRSLRHDQNFDTIISLCFPDLDDNQKEEETEWPLPLPEDEDEDEDERTHNNEIQGSSAQTLPHQTEALYRKQKARAIAIAFERRRRSQVKILDQVEDENLGIDGDKRQEASRKISSRKKKVSSTTTCKKKIQGASKKEAMDSKRKARAIAVCFERMRMSLDVLVKIPDQVEVENWDNDGDENQEVSRKTSSPKRKAPSTTTSKKVLEEVVGDEVKEVSEDSEDEDFEYGIPQSTSFKSNPSVKKDLIMEDVSSSNEPSNQFKEDKVAGTSEITPEISSNILDHLDIIKIGSEPATTHIAPSMTEVGEKEKQDDDDQSHSGSSPPKNNAKNLDDQQGENEVNINEIINFGDKENQEGSTQKEKQIIKTEGPNFGEKNDEKAEEEEEEEEEEEQEEEEGREKNETMQDLVSTTISSAQEKSIENVDLEKAVANFKRLAFEGNFEFALSKADYKEEIKKAIDAVEKFEQGLVSKELHQEMNAFVEILNHAYEAQKQTQQYSKDVDQMELSIREEGEKLAKHRNEYEKVEDLIGQLEKPLAEAESSEKELVARQEELLAQLLPVQISLKEVRQKLVEIRSWKETNEKQKELLLTTYNAESLKEKLRKKKRLEEAKMESSNALSSWIEAHHQLQRRQHSKSSSN